MQVKARLLHQACATHLPAIRMSNLAVALPLHPVVCVD